MVDRHVWSKLLAVWRASGGIVIDAECVRLPGHLVRLSEQQRRTANAWLDRLAENPMSPPTGADLPSIDPAILRVLSDHGEVEQLTPGVLLVGQSYVLMRDTALQLIDDEGQVTVARLRDKCQCSRKVSLALLEHLDDLHLTRRVGDGRVRALPAVGVSGRRGN
jgi:selenocysteine-specific elongation factor